MTNRTRWVIVLAALSFCATSAIARQKQPATKAEPSGWVIPDNAKEEKIPFEATPQHLITGEKLYAKNCMRCHGVTGKGDGPDADPKSKPDDLSDPKRAARNPDGVMFYKIWNGRKKPEMPAQKSKLAQDEVWKLVLYTKTLRKPAAAQPGKPGNSP